MALVGKEPHKPLAAAGTWGATILVPSPKPALAQYVHGDIPTPSAPEWLPQSIWACDSWAEPG